VRSHRALPVPPYRGSGRCRWCAGPIYRRDGRDRELNLRRLWHRECADYWTLRSQPSTLRWFVNRRDRGICAECGRDTEGEARRIAKLRRVAYELQRARRYGRHEGVLTDAEVFPPTSELGRAVERKIRRDVRDGALCGDWEADHWTPLADGGSMDTWNVVTLCRPCHKAKTAREAGERAERRKRDREAAAGILALEIGD
jgi:5-methylcytosine-specific restriction endonuclease McrA